MKEDSLFTNDPAVIAKEREAYEKQKKRERAATKRRTRRTTFVNLCCCCCDPVPPSGYCSSCGIYS